MTTVLKLGPGFTLPLDTVTQAIAIIAKRRAGKSFTARRMAEQLHHAGQQIVIVDPKGDWWGIRSAADGKGPGLPIIILGGDRGDVPLEVGAGEIVAKLVVEDRVSALLDLSLFRKHELATFMASFLETLYRLKARELYRTPMMLIIDEADAIAPQNPKEGQKERMLGAAEDIVRRGGQRGIGCTLITQRTAVLNKNVLTQAQVLVALRTIAPQDLKAMQAWIDVHGTAEQRDELMKVLPSLPIGDAWFWSPGWPTDDGIFSRIHVLPITTFDSGATPKPGEKRREPRAAADVDLDALRRQMAETIERAKADDPRTLRARIAQLERDLAAKRAPAPAVQPKRVEVPVLTDRQLDRIEQLAGRFQKASDSCTAAMGALARRAGDLAAAARSDHPPTLSSVPRRPETRLALAAAAVPRPPAAPRAGNGAAPELDKAARAILAVLGQHQSRGCAATRLTLLAGYRWSGGFRNALSSLRSQGLIVGANTEQMVITSAGLAALGTDYEPLPIGRELIGYWQNHRALGACERAIFKTLVEVYPRGLRAEQLGEKTGYAWSGGFRNGLSALRTAGLIEGRNTEEMRASEHLFTSAS